MPTSPPIGRRGLLLGAAAALAAPLWPRSALGAAPSMEVWTSPGCGCCGAWVEHLRAAGVEAAVTEIADLAPLKARLGVPPALRSCHTGVVEGYAVEGHVPAADVLRLLRERPRATGLAVPGMPVGSPGMEAGEAREPFDVLLFAPGGVEVFARR